MAGAIVDTHTVHEEYPPLVPLLEAWLFQHRGSVSIDLAKAIWAVVGAGSGSWWPWPVFVTLGWGIGLVMNAWEVFIRKPITELL